MNPSEIFRTRKGARVALKQDRADIYMQAFGGAEGWIRGQKTELGFPMVYVEWDRSHWTFNGQPNMWTFEDHFDIVNGDNIMPKENNKALTDALQALTEALTGHQAAESQPKAQDETEAQPDSPVLDNNLLDTRSDSDVDDPESYIEAVGLGHEAASESSAFFLIAVQEHQNPANPEDISLIPHIISSYQSPMSGLFLEIQLGHIAAMAHEQSNVRLMRRHTGD